MRLTKTLFGKTIHMSIETKSKSGKTLHENLCKTEPWSLRYLGVSLEIFFDGKFTDINCKKCISAIHTD